MSNFMLEEVFNTAGKYSNALSSRDDSIAGELYLSIRQHRLEVNLSLSGALKIVIS